MVQAAVGGAMDFAEMDPRNRLWWQKLRWVLETLNNQNMIRVLEAQHRHWVTTFANPALSTDSFESTKNHARETLNQLIRTLCPWLGDDTAVSGTGDLISEFREMYGYPGDPRYDQMLEDMMAAFARLEKGYA